MIFLMPNPELTFDIDEVLRCLQERVEFYHFEVLYPESIAIMSYSNVAHY